MKRTPILTGSILTITLLLMIPVMPSVEYQQIENTIDHELKENRYSIIHSIASFFTTKKEYTASIEEVIEQVKSDNCDCDHDTEEEPSVYIPIVCEIVTLTVLTIALFLDLLAYICSILGNFYLAYELLDLQQMIIHTVIPIFC